MAERTSTPIPAALNAFVGEWTVEAVFPSQPGLVMRGALSVFEWMKGEQVLVQRTTIPIMEAPDSTSFVVPDPANPSAYVQHYFDSRGIARIYAMTFRDGLWTLERTTADLTPLDFSQRYTGRFTENDTVITGAWEQSSDGIHWEPDFELSYRRSS